MKVNSEFALADDEAKETDNRLRLLRVRSESAQEMTKWVDELAETKTNL